MTPPAFGAHRQGPGTSSMAAARGAFKCRRKGLGVVRIAALRLWHTTDMSNAWVYVLRFAAYANREGWWSRWLVVGFRSVGLGFESHKRK